MTDAEYLRALSKLLYEHYTDEADGRLHQIADRLEALEMVPVNPRQTAEIQKESYRREQGITEDEG